MPANKHRNINLLPREDFERTTLGRIMKWALTSFRFIVIVVEFVVIGGFLFRFYLDVQISNLDDEIQQKSALISSRSSFEQEFRAIQKRLEIYAQITDEDNKTSPAFLDVTASLPSDTQLLSFTKRRDTLEISGATLNEASIGSFISNLEQKDRFLEVSLKQISIPKDSPFVQFDLVIKTSRGA